MEADSSGELDGLALIVDQDADGRWVAEIPAVPGAVARGHTAAEASEIVAVLAAEAIRARRARMV